jgi:hypothetical protein
VSGSGGETAFRDGLVALEEDRAEEAFGQLERTRRICGTSPLGQQAVLVEAAAALGGRVGPRDARRAAELSAAFLRQPSPPAWGVPIAESLYLMAREMGAARPSEEATAAVFEDAAGEVGSRADCEPRWEAASRAGTPVPSLEGTGVATELQRLRDRLGELEEEVERLRALLKMPEDDGG